MTVQQIQSAQQDAPARMQAGADKPENPAARSAFSGFGLREIISGGIAGLAAYIMSRTSVYRRFFTNVHRREIYDEVVKLKGQYTAGSREDSIIQEFENIQKSHYPNVAKAIVAYGKTDTFPREFGKTQKLNEKAVDELWERLGVNSVLKKFVANKPHQKEEVIRVAIIAGAATLGAAYSLVNNKKVAELFRRQDRKAEDRQAGR